MLVRSWLLHCSVTGQPQAASFTVTEAFACHSCFCPIALQGLRIRAFHSVCTVDCTHAEKSCHSTSLLLYFSIWLTISLGSFCNLQKWMSAPLQTEWFLAKQKSYMFYIYITAYAFVQSDIQFICLSVCLCVFICLR